MKSVLNSWSLRRKPMVGCDVFVKAVGSEEILLADMNSNGKWDLCRLQRRKVESMKREKKKKKKNKIVVLKDSYTIHT